MRNISTFAVLFLAALASSAHAITPPGIVYEAEAISEPKDAWVKNVNRPDRWTLWTREPDIDKKRSGGAVLCSPAVAQDRNSPAEGAPPLHSVVRDLKPGFYQVFVSPPGRPLAYSLDGQNWFRHAGGELALGLKKIEGPFELWVDDRYAYPPGNPGPGYYDYIRFVPVPADALGFDSSEAWNGLDYWLRSQKLGFAVPAWQLKAEGFELNPGRGALTSQKPGSQCSHTFAADGTFYLAVQLYRGSAVEELSLSLGEQRLGRLMPLDLTSGSVLFSRREPLTVHKGDRLVLTSNNQATVTIEALFLSRQPVKIPEPQIQNVETWSPAAGTIDVCWTTTRAVPTGSLEYGIGAAQQTSPDNPAIGRNHRVRLQRLDATATYTARIVSKSAGCSLASPAISFRPGPPTPPVSRHLEIPLTVAEPTGHVRRQWPALVGIPFAQGALARTDDLRLLNADGKGVPCQIDLFSRWPDGSVKWAVVSFLADSQAATGGKLTPGYRLQTTGALPADPEQVPLMTVPPRPAPAKGELPLGIVPNGQMEVLTGDGTRLICGPADDQEVEVDGPVRAVIRYAGPLLDPQGKAAWRYLLRVSYWLGQPMVGVDLSLCNDQPQPRFRPLKSFEVRLPLRGQIAVGSLEGHPWEPITRPLPFAPMLEGGPSLLQDRDNRFHLRSVHGNVDGQRATGQATIANDDERLSVAVKDFWQMYPRGLAIKQDGIHVQLLPPLPPDTYDDDASRKLRYLLYAWFDKGQYLFRSGQLTRHEFWVRYDRPGRLPAEGRAPAAEFADWATQPLLPQAPPEYLCATRVLGRALAPATPGVWDAYEKYFADSFRGSGEDLDRNHTFGWMHYGDWFGERYLNYGNNEYDQAWALAVQWMRTGRRDYFDRGLATARHYSSVDTLHGDFTRETNGLVFEHSYNHVGTDRTPEELGFNLGSGKVADYLEQYGRSMLHGAIDRQGHVFQEGNWIYAALRGDQFLRDVAERVSTNQAAMLTPNFDFGIERAGGWPLINAATAYRFSGNPYYLNAARLMIQRCLERQDPDSGGWLHFPPLSETGGVACHGGKAFAVGILSYGIMRYLDEEPRPRPDVRRMLVRGADWLMQESWQPGKGFRYISNCPKYAAAGARELTCLLNAEIVAFAAQETGDQRYRDFWLDMLRGRLGGNSGGMGKSFAQAIRQTIFGLDRMRELGITQIND